MLTVRDRETGKPTYLLGLTDVNLRRLSSADEDGSVTVPIGEFAADGLTLEPDSELIVFYATRERCLDLARLAGVDERTFLDQLGEG